ncbi:hypothetical protein PybrP1_005582 [[Pythium] brassicae (nom. inval.)]|nr:hypothetical protein PybrP1_005582 [[Pythium] brassicae (nom. inval.)]
MPTVPRRRNASDDDSALSGSSSDASDSVVGAPGAYARTDEISTAASWVLADLDKFFDPALCDSESDVEGNEGTQWSAISLDELSVVLNASIQRHQPHASQPDSPDSNVRAAGHPPAPTVKPAMKPRSSRHERLPFAHFLELRKQKAQLFHERRRDSRRSPVRRRGRTSVAPPRGQRWRFGGSDSSGVSSSASSMSEEEGEKEEPEEPKHLDDESDNRDEQDADRSSEVSSSLEDESDAATASATRVDARWVAAAPLVTRDAVTQATLMQDQGQQTASVSKRQQVADMPAMRLSRGSRTRERSVAVAAHSLSEGGSEPRPNSSRAQHPKPLSLSLRPFDVLVEPQSLSSANASSSASSPSSASFSNRSAGGSMVDNLELTRIAPTRFSANAAQGDQQTAASPPEVPTFLCTANAGWTSQW